MFGGKRSLVLGVALVLLAQGCELPEKVHVASATDAGRANELAATAQYRDQRLQADVKVSQVGLKRVQRESGTARPGWGKTEIDVHHYTVAVPYLYAVDANGGGDGRLLCFFDTRLMDKVAQIQTGAYVRVSGQFQQFSDNGSTMVLRDCDLD